MDDREPVRAGDERGRRRRHECREIAQMHDRAILCANRDIPERVEFGLIHKRVDDLHLLESLRRLELGCDVSTEGRPRCRRRASQIHVERLEFCAIELQRDLRRERRAVAVHAGCTRSRPQQVEHLLRSLRRVAAVQVRHEKVDGLRVAAARAGRRHHDRGRVGHRRRGDLPKPLNPGIR